MVEIVARKRRQIAEQKAKARRDRPMSQAEQKSDFSDNLLSKNQSLALSYKKGWTMTYLKSLSQIAQEAFERLPRPSSKRPKPVEVEATSAAMEDTSAQLPIPSEDVQTSKESKNLRIPIETGDPDAKHKMCLKYASDKEDDSDCDTLVPFYAVIDWELLLRDKEADGVGLILWGDLRVLIDSLEVDDGSEFLESQHNVEFQKLKFIILFW
ncbi:hypothetical protein Tco_0893929 [Tanacetum coccineum]|uniref:Uncharacterized protein n=1 Tax=Tanacetum coccineum TaxID=301880 RepID=A0ABQ5CBS2_9ASTR